MKAIKYSSFALIGGVVSITSLMQLQEQSSALNLLLAYTWAIPYAIFLGVIAWDARQQVLHYKGRKEQISIVRIWSLIQYLAIAQVIGLVLELGVQTIKLTGGLVA